MKLAVIGTGQMGQALIRAMLRQAVIPASDLVIFDQQTEKAAQLAEETGCQAAVSGPAAASRADVVLLAVKPQVFDAVLRELTPSLANGTLILSIAAGVTLARMNHLTEYHPALALGRIMPNTPALVGSGVSAVCFQSASREQQDWTLQMLRASGLVFTVNESAMDAVTGLSGSGPAYIMLVIEALADGGVRMGLPRDMALQMAAMTVLGSARLVLETNTHPAVLKDQVCSPGGTTIEAIAALEAGGLRATLIEAVTAATRRSQALGQPRPDSR